MRAILLVAFLATPTLAEPISGLDDPAFRAPFDRALQGEDPIALKEMHQAAQAGNTAAVLALPVVSDWLRTTLPFSERKKLARVNDVPLAEAFAAADPTAALWALGDPGTDMDALLQRAFGLYAADEPDKATFLFMTWVNQTGGYGDLPPGFFDHHVPPWAMAQLLRGRLIDSGYSPPEEGAALISDRLKSDDPAAWMALAAYAGLHNPDAPTADAASLAAIFAAAGITQDEAARRMAAAVPAMKAFYHRGLALDPATATAATALFHAGPINTCDL